MSEVKIYGVEGVMLIGHDRLPRWQKFRVEVRALTEAQALEKVYSELGSRHKVRRSNIKILGVRELRPEEVTRKHVKDLSTLTRMVVE